MDYHTLPRRQLQTLCKKHGIPANAANSDMADALTALLKPKPQVHADNNTKQPAKRANRGRESGMGEMESKSKEVEEVPNMKHQEPTNSLKILEEESNRKPQRVTRGRGTARAVLEAPRSATLKTEKTPTTDETKSNYATKQQEAKKVRTRNGASKQTNSEMPTNAEENVDSKVASPKCDKKKEKAGGIVLRRGRVKVRSPGNLSKSPESEKINAVRTEVGVPSSQSCLVNAKKTRKKKRSVTFSDVLEINSACIEHDVEEPAKETMAEISLGADPNLLKSTNSACIAKRVLGTRKASRSVSTKDGVQDVIGAQADHQKSSKEPLAKASKAEGIHAFDAEKTADIDIGGQSDRKKSVRGKKILNSVGEAHAKENEEEKIADGFIKGEHIEDVPCTRRSRRLTIVPTDVKFNQDMQLGTEQLKGGQSKNHHEGSSISTKKTEGALPAETSRKSRRKTLAPLELNHVQSNVLSASEQKEKRVSKAKETRSKAYASELKDDALESKQKRSACCSTPVATQPEGPPIKKKEALSVRNVRGSRQKALVATKEVSNEMGYQNNCTTEIISGKVEKNVHTIESEKADSQAPLSSSIHANSEPHSLQEVSNDAKVEVETVKTTSVMPRSTRKTSKVSTCPDNGTAVSKEQQSNIVKQEGLVFVDEAVGRNIQDSEDLDVIEQAYIEKSQEILVLKNTNEPRVEDLVNSALSNEDINNSNSFSSAFEIVTGEGEGQNQINSGDANSVSYNEEFAYNTCPTATHHATCDSETANSSPLVDKLDAADVECHEFTEETTSASSSECVQQGHEFTNEKDLDVLKQEGHGMDELACIISLTRDINEKSRSNFPVSIMIQDNGNHHMKCIDSENITDIHTDEGITAGSPGATVESTFQHQNCIDIGIHTNEDITFEHQNSIDIATAEQESCTPEVHLLTSHKDRIANLPSGGAADLVEEQPDQAVELNLGAEDAVDKEAMKIHGDLQKEQTQDTSEGVPSDEVKSVEELSKTDDQLGQLSPLLPLCSAEPGVATPRESACKTMQRRPRSIFKSARKAKSSSPWEDRSLEQNTAPPPNKEDSLDSLDHAKKDAEMWGLDSHEMSCDEVDSASSEEEESSAETEETLSDTEVCNFNTEVLISNTEGDYSCSEDDTPSDMEEDTMSDSEDDFSEMEGELLSDEEECYESEELDTSEEELSESEEDAEDDFEEYEASPVANSESFDALCMTTHGLEDRQVATTAPSNSESFDALCTMHGLQDRQVATIVPSKSSHADDGITQPEIVNHLALVNITNGCVPDVDPTDIDDVQMSHNDDTAMERVQSTTVSTCEDGDSLTFLSSLFATPASKVKEDVKCSLAPSSIGILESNISQQSGTLETELNILPESGQEEGVQLCSPCELSHQDVLAEVEQHTVDEAKHGSEVCKSVGAVEELEINGQMVELVEACVGYSHAGPAVVDCYTASPMLDNVHNSQLLEPDSKNVFISGNENEQIHTSASESPCLGPCELILEGNGAEMGIEEDAMDVQEEPGNFKIIQDGIEEDEAGNVEVKNDLENNGVSVGMAIDAQNEYEDFTEQVDRRDGTSELTEELMLTAVASTTLAVDDNSNEWETVAEQDRQILHLNSDFSMDDLPQKQDNEDALALDTAHNAIGTTDSVVSFESAKELDTSCHLLEEGEPLLPLECEQDLMPSDDSEQPKTEARGEEQEVIHSESSAQGLVDLCSTPKCSKDSETTGVFNHESLDEVAQTLHCVEIESVNVQVEELHAKPLDESQSSEDSNEGKEPAAEHNLISKEQSMKQIDPLPSDDSEQPKTEARGEEPEVIHSESSVQGLIDLCSTPKCSKDSETMRVFNHESLDEVAQTLHCVEIESLNAQVEELHEKPSDESQSSEDSNEGKEAAAEHNLISKEQSMKQIDLTLLSVRKLRQMCKGNPMSAKKKTENATPARKPWMSATKQVHQPNTSMHPRDLPSGNKRSALQALSSNFKAAPSAAMQTPTAKVLQRPRNLMGTLDGNEGTGKHLVTPSPQAPMSSKRDFARSHHR